MDSENPHSTKLKSLMHYARQWASAAGRQARKADVGKENDDDDDDDNKDKPPLLILWGSQSGTAQGFAEEMVGEGRRHGFRTKRRDIESYDRQKLKDEKFVLLLQATYGEGDPTDNAREFAEWLEEQQKTKHTKLNNLIYSVFALGNKQYTHFCGAGRKFDEALHELGGKRLMQCGMGNDDESLQDDYEEWKQRFWQEAKSKFDIKDSEEGDDDGKHHAKHTLEITDANGNMEHIKHGLTAFKPRDTKHQSYLCPVVENRELRAANKEDPDSSTRHVEISIADHYPDLTYRSADNLYVWPRNGEKLVQQGAKRFGLELEQVISIKAKRDDNDKHHGKDKDTTNTLGLPTKLTANDLFAAYLDVNSLSSPRHCRYLLSYITDEASKHKSELKHWCESEDGKKEFKKSQFSIMEVLQRFDEIDVPLVEFIEWCPKLKARPYTISSSNLVQSRQIAITLALAITKLDHNRRHEGTATHYIRSLEPGKDRVWIYVTPSTFRLPRALPPQRADKSVPVIMIGPGTGIAPFRAFLHEIRKVRRDGRYLGPVMLFTGCRNRKLDYIYESELNDFVATETKVLHTLHLAFSRESQDGQKQYVQHKLHGNGKIVWEWMHDRNGMVYVCGGTAMGQATRDAIVKIAKEHGQCTDEEANDFMKKLQEQKRYIAELWS